MPQLFETPPKPHGRLARLASGYAWFFGVGSLLALLLILATRASSIASGSACIFGWHTPDGGRHTGWLMDYTGQSGYVLAAIQAGLVLAALIGSCLRHPPARHISLLFLLAWSALWPINAARQTLAMRTWETLGYTTASALAVVASYKRARDRWSLPDDDDEEHRRPRAHPLTA